MAEALYADSVIFSTLSPLHRQHLLKGAKLKHYKKGDVIFSRGDRGDWMLVIESGVVEISVVAMDGRKSVMNYMEAGDVLGEIAILDDHDRSADAIATEETSGHIIHRHILRSYLEKNNDACFTIIETLCNRVRNASDMFENRSLTAASARLARCILRIAEKWGEQHSQSIVINHPISQSDLGDFSGIARENVNRYIKNWEKDGILSFKKTGIILLNIDKLEDLVHKISTLHNPPAIESTRN